MQTHRKQVMRMMRNRPGTQLCYVKYAGRVFYSYYLFLKSGVVILEKSAFKTTNPILFHRKLF